MAKIVDGTGSTYFLDNEATREELFCVKVKLILNSYIKTLNDYDFICVVIKSDVNF